MKKSILIGLLLFAGYNIWLKLAQPWQEKVEYPYWVLENHGKAQQYLDDSVQPSWVLCGSSLSSVIEPWLPDSVYGLSMTGGSYLTGLEIIRSSGKVPPVIGIEINLLLRLEDVYVTNALYHPVMGPLRKWIPAFNDYNQPVTYFASHVLASANLEQKRKKLKNEIFLGTEVLEKALPEKQAEYLTVYDSVQSAEMLTYIQELARNFETAGARIFLYEMPQDTSLMQSVRYKDLRQKVRQLPFPFIPAPSGYAWRTRDGEHLIATDAFAFAHWLLSRNISDYIPAGK